MWTLHTPFRPWKGKCKEGKAIDLNGFQSSAYSLRWGTQVKVHHRFLSVSFQHSCDWDAWALGPLLLLHHFHTQMGLVNMYFKGIKEWAYARRQNLLLVQLHSLSLSWLAPESQHSDDRVSAVGKDFLTLPVSHHLQLISIFTGNKPEEGSDTALWVNMLLATSSDKSSESEKMRVLGDWGIFPSFFPSKLIRC